MQEAVRIYIQGLPSYRVLATLVEARVGRPVGRVTINNWVHNLGGQAKTPLETSIELQPRWGGFLGVDGKAIYVRGTKHCLLIGVDHPTQDLVHALVLPAESAEGFARLETEARLDAGYPLRGVVSDFAPGFAQAHRDRFGAVPFQACRVHFDRRLDSEIPKSKWSVKAPLYAELRERIRQVLYATTYDEARQHLRALADERRRFKGIGNVNVVRALERNFDVYMAHHFTPGLPADNNVTENVIKQLNKKVRLMEGFQSLNRPSAMYGCSSAATASSASLIHAVATANHPSSLPVSICKDETGYRSSLSDDHRRPTRLDARPFRRDTLPLERTG